ncbi:iron chelate uptake ABC transporter family permease subunit [Aquibium microcysteis]|uniref:iron chelate uptake ABC transporter family permease subunit n=1 Tax=Aquibium microcysteis TaxID=675281 RepID=UPI001EF35AB3|nr:iron chelate uptake ABC transporter family permease subunit [Aquibium microcysteis]
MADAAPDRSARRETIVLAGLAAAALACAVLYMTIGVRGGWAFVLPFRAPKLAGMVVVAVAVAFSTVVFQTVTRNRILTPAIMGFDSLYVAIQTALVFVFGSRVLATLDADWRFIGETSAMVGFSVVLFRWLLSEHGRGIHLLVLTGVVFGMLFRSLASMLQRVLDPNEFSALQDLLFASFNTIDAGLLGVTGLASGVCCAWLLSIHRTLDVLSLGRDAAVGLGVPHARLVTRLLFVVAVLVSASTALVGPIAFFGLLVANLAYLAVGHRHRPALVASALIAVVAVVGGQAVLEHALKLGGVLGVVIEFVGGIAFIVLLMRGIHR